MVPHYKDRAATVVIPPSESFQSTSSSFHSMMKTYRKVTLHERTTPGITLPTSPVFINTRSFATCMYIIVQASPD